MNASRWYAFSKSYQLLTVGAELTRAAAWQGKDEKNFNEALERALALVDLTLSDKKWHGETRMLLGLREEIAKFYTKERKENIIELYRAL